MEEAGIMGRGGLAGEAQGSRYWHGYGRHPSSHSNTNAGSGSDSAGLFTRSPPNPTSDFASKTNAGANAHMSASEGGAFGDAFGGGGGVLSSLKNLIHQTRGRHQLGYQVLVRRECRVRFDRSRMRKPLGLWVGAWCANIGGGAEGYMLIPSSVVRFDRRAGGRGSVFGFVLYVLSLSLSSSL
ncbi:hypothetical protein BOTBODRAFT_246577 [Botryobasidium botryosum FD-172 SS1]|uniref:Uncharacterized protein n=1 Tax=Botryobasidium botryosum (strain FD-172 SS1) TaxID=930990 RepID=A0A067M3T6_BOTB1|nr:hypothetical protein BOTBODRAFT_246577 [Botryobasidium botryosum FD-172 SS1]